MAGRFISAPLVLSAIAASRVPVPPMTGLLAAVGLTVAGLVLTPHPNLVRTSAFFVDPRTGIKGHGIVDEAGCYFQDNGLLNYGTKGRRLRERLHAQFQMAIANGQSFQVMDTVGIAGLVGGPGVHILDVMALADPLLARLPAMETPYWRTGHFRRAIPEGYMETLLSGEDRLADRNLAVYWGHLARITRGPLLARERWRSIWLVNTGRLERLVDRGHYRSPFREEVGSTALPMPSPVTHAWMDLRNIQMRPSGLTVDFSERRYGACIVVELSPFGESYRIEALRLVEGVPVSVQEWSIDPPQANPVYMTPVFLPVDANAAAGGYDALRVAPGRVRPGAAIGTMQVRDGGCP